MRIRTLIAAVAAPLALGGVLLTATAASAATTPAQFRSIDVPGAASAVVNSVNNQGTALGTWWDSKGVNHGYIEQAGGQPVKFEVPGTSNAPVNPAYINDLGTAVGWWAEPSGVCHGWVRTPDGRFLPVNHPSAVLATNPTGISDNGVIVGVYYINPSQWHGFIDADGTFRTLDYPGAVNTSLIGVSNSGTILGTWSDGSGTAHGFLYRDGKFTTFDAPGATAQGTYPQGISSDGTIVGFTPSADFSSASSWMLRGGHFSPLTIPGAAQGQTWAFGISSSAHYVGGAYSSPADPSGVAHGFVATLSS